jgi:predicted NAD/FAD-dependent oxidoreductase
LNISADGWTQVAHSYRDSQGWRRWVTEDGSDIDALYADAATEKVILMQRRRDTEWQIVARLPSPAWRTVQRWRMRRPLALPTVRRWRA